MTSRACSHTAPDGFRCPLPALEQSGGWGESWDAVCDLHDRHDPVRGSVRLQLQEQYDAARQRASS